MAWIPIPGVDPRIKGRWINLSPQRRFVCDLLYFARAVPSVPTQRRMQLADLIEARGRRPERISWCAIFIKAFAIVAAARPELRRAYLPLIWPHLYEHPINVASFSLERTYRNEPGVFFARIARPEQLSLRHLDALVRHYKSAPVETVPTFMQALWISRLPRPLRRLVWAIGLYSDGACRGHFFGTFGISVVGSRGAGGLAMSLVRTLRFALRTDRLGKVPRWSDARRDRLASRRLRSLVAFAAARSPFYRRLYQGIDLKRFRLEDLPPITKDMLREHFDDVLTDPLLEQSDLADFVSNPANLGKWYRGRYVVSHTSGSQGPPLFIVQDRFAIELLFSLMSARANAGTKPGPLEGVRRLREPARVAVVALHRGFYPSSSAFEFMAAETAPFTNVRWFSIADPDLVAQLADFQPHSLVGYASVLEGLALEADRLGLRNLRQIANSSEQLAPRARRRIEAAFGVTVMDHYGTGECLFLSDGCPTDGGAHVNADWAILENVDDDNRPVPPGQPGRKVLVTNLANRVQPFIRYEVPDRIVMATEPCRCGSRPRARPADRQIPSRDHARQGVPGSRFPRRGRLTLPCARWGRQKTALPPAGAHRPGLGRRLRPFPRAPLAAVRSHLSLGTRHHDRGIMRA